ncbi:MAG: RNA 2',3'-cyclic phosphodiesterase [Candidatus Doudnabacteria bacterium]|nr:RNA 2',3'-cyclic phosphodiesterase [Candidatus Doudnabacteria bacterium]
MKRIFVSIDLPEFAEKILSSVRREDIRWIKWMKTENLHITLNFLGDLNEAEIRKADAAIAAVALYYKAFVLKFSNLRSERDMLWLVPDESRELSDLQKAVQQKLRETRIGKRERREYIPHILLAKSKTGRPMEWKPENFQGFEFEVRDIHLYESRLTPGAATHILIKSFPLSP